MSSTPRRRAAIAEWRRAGGSWGPWMARMVEAGWIVKRKPRGRPVFSAANITYAERWRSFPKPQRYDPWPRIAVHVLTPESLAEVEAAAYSPMSSALDRPPPDNGRADLIERGLVSIAARPGPDRQRLAA